VIESTNLAPWALEGGFAECCGLGCGATLGFGGWTNLGGWDFLLRIPLGMDRGSLEDGLGGGSLGGLGCRLKKFRVYVECGRGTITKDLSGCFDKNFTKTPLHPLLKVEIGYTNTQLYPIQVQTGFSLKPKGIPIWPDTLGQNTAHRFKRGTFQ
jgi:hypothetical protein